MATLEKNNNGIKQKVLKFFSMAFDIVSGLLAFGLLLIIIQQLYSLFILEFTTSNTLAAIDGILFTLILIELFTILYSYVKRHYVKVERVIEVGIIAVVKEIVFKIAKFDFWVMLGISAILLSLGALFFIEKYYAKSRNVE